MDKQKLLEAFIENPTSYKIEVSDNSMLPIKLKSKKTIDFIIKPPVLSVLAKCASVIEKIPQEIKGLGTEVEFKDAIKYLNEMAQVFSILAHGKITDYPDWYVPFIINNCTPKDIFQLFQESALKTQSSFFLNSIQIANTNPMAMM